VISLLMGQLCGLAEADLLYLGVGALSHDIGKLELPGHLHKPDEHWGSAETAHYREHVALGVALGQRMGLTPGALLVIGQHHELFDRSGFPQAIDGGRMSVAARLVALVNRYHNLCRPSDTERAMTPHDAMSQLFSQGQKRYDPALLSTFVRMMGVYPPGSGVQLTDYRFAVVESVSAARPLKPKVTVAAEPGADDAVLMLDLAQQPALGIRRSCRRRSCREVCASCCCRGRARPGSSRRTRKRPTSHPTTSGIEAARPGSAGAAVLK
jgi:hypothetical protein